MHIAPPIINTQSVQMIGPMVLCMYIGTSCVHSTTHMIRHMIRHMMLCRYIHTYNGAMPCAFMTRIHFSYVEGVPCSLTEMGEEFSSGDDRSSAHVSATARPTVAGKRCSRGHTCQSMHAQCCKAITTCILGVTHSSVLQVVTCWAVVDCFQITEHWKVVQRDFS